MAIAVAKSCALSGIGADIELSFEDERWVFDETPSRAIVEVKEENIAQVAQKAMNLGLNIVSIGRSGGDRVRINDIEMDMTSLRDIYFGTFKKVVEQDL